MPDHFGFVRVAAASPVLALADPATNAARTLALLRRAADEGVAVVAFPEMGLAGYTCHDLFHQPVLLRAAVEALEELAGQAASIFRGLAIVGLPLVVDNQVFNCAAAFQGGRVLGIVPKSYLPNYKEFYDARYFAPASQARSATITLPSGASVPFGTDLLFSASEVEGLIVGVEICEDLWAPVPPSCHQALAGATVLVNLSASNELVGKVTYRRQLVTNQSARCIAAYLYAGAGVGESSQDLVFGGHCLIAENGTMLGESERFSREPVLLTADVDLDRVRADRWHITSFGQSSQYEARRNYRTIPFSAGSVLPDKLLRFVEAHPFVPKADAALRERCDEIFHIQVSGLARRMEQIGRPCVTIGVSGGLDSTLALVVTCKTFDLLQMPRTQIHAYTMPGFGTTGRTKTNAHALMKQLGVTAYEVDIRPLCLAEWNALEHEPFGIPLAGLDVDSLTAKLRERTMECLDDLVFQNVQARARTNLLMNAGFVIGTGDVSELALGWCTYNADHMSMYGVNCSVPKTLVKFLVRWVADVEFSGETRKTLYDIAGTEISPELLPVDAHGAIQSTEAALGPYEVHDFFLFHFLRYGAPPTKLLYLAQQAAFDHDYTADDLKKWLGIFLCRFFTNQFKRSCLPDGPKVGSVSLSPRGDWRMPSDAHVTAWLADL